MLKKILNLTAVIWRKKWLRICTILVLTITMFYFFFMNYTEPTDLGIARDRFTGETWAQDKGGWHITPFWVSVSTIDTRPVRVEVNSAGHGYSAKLVQFDKKYWREFINVEGFYYHWWANRISFNYGYDEEYRGMRDLLRGYAYGSVKYPFLKLITEYQ